ncbi:MAG: phosphoribosylanthranilate isomerase [Candidatus Omnitrophica bacterium]|nr:phosphoribosylanthranilate isomerase [Candidatus Omnitrophota bacterium]
MIKIKICGITNLEDAIFCSKAGVDALGFIFTKKSPRYISKINAKKIIDKIDPYIVRVGVFADQKKEEIIEIAKEVRLDALQFHGKESASYCNFFKKHFRIIKTIFVDEPNFYQKINRYNVDAYLFDIRLEEKTEGKNEIPKEILKQISLIIKSGKRIILAGGINPYNVDKFIKLNPYAIDVSSGVESFVGEKEPHLVELLIKKIKNEFTR